MAAVTALRLRNEGGPALCGQLLLHPVTDYHTPAAEGHEDQFPPPRLSAGCGFRKETFAGAHGNGRDAPIPDLRCRRGCEDYKRIRYAMSAASSAFASFRSTVSKPSVNQP